MNNFGVFLNGLKDAEDDIVDKIRMVVKMHQLEIPDRTTLESALTQIGHILINSSGDPRPNLKVEVTL